MHRSMIRSFSLDYTVLLAILWTLSFQHGLGTASTSKCQISEQFNSPYVSAYTEHSIENALWCVTNATTDKNQEVHVINLRESTHSQHLKSSGTRQRDIYVSIKPHKRRGKYWDPIVVVLNSADAVTWRVETIKLRNNDAQRHWFVISKDSRIYFDNFSLQYTVLQEDDMPREARQLRDWAKQKYGAITSLTELRHANGIVLEVGLHKLAGNPGRCRFERRPSYYVRGYDRTKQNLAGCAVPSNIHDKKSKAVHVIEITGYNGRPTEVVVDILPSIIGRAHADMILILKAPIDKVSWRVRSRKVQGSIEIIGNTLMVTQEVNMDPVSTRIDDVSKTGQELVSWVEYLYGPVGSYSATGLVTHFRLLIADQGKKASYNDDMTGGADLLPAFLPEADNWKKISPFSNPSQTESFIRQHLMKVCYSDGLEVYLLKDIAQVYDLKGDQLSLRNPSCLAQSNRTHYILRTDWKSCGTREIIQGGKMFYSNSLVIKTHVWLDDTDAGSGNGFQYDGDEIGSGYQGDHGASDEIEVADHGVSYGRTDDEDYRIRSLEISLECESYATKNQDSLLKSHVDDQLLNKTPVMAVDTIANVKYALSIYSDPKYEVHVERYPLHVKDRQRIYIKASVDTAEPDSRAQVHNCWVTSTSTHRGPSKFILVMKGCNGERSVRWHESVASQMSASQLFSLEVYRYHESTIYYLHCQITVCHHGYKPGNPEILQCMDQQQNCIDNHQNADRNQQLLKHSEIVTLGPIILPDSAKMNNNDMAFHMPDMRMSNHHNKKVTAKANGMVTTTSAGQSDADTRPCGIVEGLDSGTVIGIAFAAFVIGVLLTGALWYIHSHTGPAKCAHGSHTWTESSGESTPCSSAPFST